MKTSIKLIVFLLFIIAVKGQSHEAIQITNDSLSYDNPSTPQYFGNTPFWWGDESTFLLTEINNGNSINIGMIRYDHLTDLFLPAEKITDNDFINKNATASNGYYSRHGIMLWESNSSGNFNIYFKTKPIDDSVWSETDTLIASDKNEINPRLTVDTYFQKDNYWFTFERENDFYLAEILDSAVNEQLIFSSDENVSYGNINSAIGDIGNILVLAEKDSINFAKQLVAKIFNSSGEIVLDTTLFNNIISYDMNRVGYDFGGFFIKYIENGAIKQMLYFPEYFQNKLSLNWDEDITDLVNGEIIHFDAFTADLPVSPDKRDYAPFFPYVYSLQRDDSSFIYTDEYNDSWYNLPVSIPLKYKDTKPVIGSFSMNYGMVSYSIWADSLDGKLQLFGVKRIDPYGAVEDEKLNPRQIYLSQNYPNPFNPTTTIEYTIPSSSVMLNSFQHLNKSKTPKQVRGDNNNVTLKVFDILGREIATLVNEQKSPGTYTVTFDSKSVGRELPSGVYIYQIRSGKYNSSRKMILIK